MSSRLKRKLGELGVDPSSARANESFCLIGTPLPPLEKSKDNGEFVPLWKQDVRDEKGRRRLHGAFTGGFSAGYFNSVGSKEGWTPSTFVSSRADRAKHKAARPEDFMDEEDLQELKDGQNLVDTTDEMDLVGGTKAELQRRGGMEESEDSIASILEKSMLPAPKDSAGARILKKMGWRIGQGIGPRVTLRQRKMQDLQASSGQNLTGDDIDIPDDDEEANKHTYAPRDTPILLVERKDNYHGLGYRPGMGLNESLGVKDNVGVAGLKVSAGFGLGALNDADDDDLDVYDGGTNHSRSRTAYDIIDREEDDKVVIGGKSDTNRRKTEVRSASSVERFRDGQPVLAGFVLSDKPVAEDRWFPLPDIPKGWKPDPRRVWDKDKENLQNAEISSQPTARGKRNTGISADERGSILGETPLPSAPRSVFEYMSQKDRERLKNIASGGTLPSPGHQSHPTPAPPPATLTIPRTEPHIAHAALRGFQPFTADPTKQSRYVAYLQSQASPDDTVPLIKPIPEQKIEEFNKELEGYAKAALLFKPISGAMAGRFTSAAVVDHGPKIHEGLHTPSAEDLAEKEAKEQKEAEERISPKAHAARMGMYGPLTREMKPWQPARLLCKRFGVKDPNPTPETPVDVAATAGDASTASQRPEFSATPPTDPVVPTRNQGRRDLSNIGLGEDDDQGRDTLTYERPTMDVFKAIFASDDEDSDDEAKVVDDDEHKRDARSAVSQIAPEELRSDVPPATNVASETSTVDIGTFKPTFIPRDGKPKKSKEKKEKKRKEKRNVLVSFEMDEDGSGQSLPKPTKDRPKKKRKERQDEDEDEEMWVEKPAPDVVKDLLLARPLEPPSTGEVVSNVDNPTGGPPKGRKRAIDFM